jgi:hypothetical protein
MEFASKTIEQIKWGKNWTTYIELFIYIGSFQNTTAILMRD